MIEEIGNLIGGEHYLALLLILILTFILANRNIMSERVNQGSFWITILVCVLLIVQDIAENVAQADPARRDLRMITTIAGYALRPMAALGFLLAIWPASKPKWFLWVPAVANAILYSTAVVMPFTFYFDESYSFQRGPLNSAALIVSIVYLVLVMAMIHVRFKDRRTGDIAVIYLCALGCIGATAVDSLLGGVALISAILISSLVFYLFLRAQDMDRDPLTHLWNRRIFYEDCKKHRNAIAAVASVDMNGLKKTNDELGHEAGDRALKTMGRAFMNIMNRKVSAYRMGGDEFMILFVHCSEEEIKQVLIHFLDEIWQSGLSIAIGLATSSECGESLDRMIQVSDQRMYEDKSQYYQAHDRRRHR